MVLPTVSQRVGQEIEHLLSLLGLAPACRCAPPPTASSGRCCWRRDRSPSCRGSMMVGDLLRGALRVVPLPVPAPPRPAGLVVPPIRHPPRRRGLHRALRGHVADIAARGLGAMLAADSSRRRSDTTPPAPARLSEAAAAREHVMRNVLFDTCVYHQPGIDLLFGVIAVDNILFGSEMVGAVRGIDPETGHHFDDTKRYVDALPHLRGGPAQGLRGQRASGLSAPRQGPRGPRPSEYDDSPDEWTPRPVGHPTRRVLARGFLRREIALICPSAKTRSSKT